MMGDDDDDPDAALARRLAEEWAREEAEREAADLELARKLQADFEAAAAVSSASQTSVASEISTPDVDHIPGETIVTSISSSSSSSAEDNEDALQEELCARLQQEIEDAAAALALQQEVTDEDLAKRLHGELNAEETEAQEQADLRLAKRLHEQLNVAQHGSSSFASIVKKNAPPKPDSSPPSLKPGKRRRRSTLGARSNLTKEDLAQELRITKPSMAVARSLRTSALSKFSRLHLMEPDARAAHQTEADDAMAYAASLVFAYNNQELAAAVLSRARHLPIIKVDFHYLLLHEALDRLEVVLQIAQDLAWTKIDFVCGAGLNSTNHRARIGPTVRARLEQLRRLHKYVEKLCDHGNGNLEVQVLSV